MRFIENFCVYLRAILGVEAFCRDEKPRGGVSKWGRKQLKIDKQLTFLLIFNF